ncbi:MAG: hypothetical protein OEO18_08950, partial [Gammaproteobacteria bacterium]|nr:hypothetical protein [Gammaproteobacteria bacterium]
MSQHARILTCITLILLAFCGRALGFSGGITGYSGNPASSGSGAYCSLCHNTGVIPVVAISGSQNVAPGTTSTYSFTINDSPQLIGGLNVSASAGTLQLRPADQSLKKIGQELTHAQPATITGALTWQFDWLAPSTPGTYTLYAAGVIADGDQSAAGDNAAIDSFTVTVAPSGPTPIPVISAPLTATPGQSIVLDGSA